MAAAISKRGLEKELKFRTSRSGGKGGQHVNKVSTKVELIFNVRNSRILDLEEKLMIKERLGHKISSEGNLRIVAELYRSQLKNKEVSIERFYKMIAKALKRPKYRKPTEPTKASVDRRFRVKHIASEKKQRRKKVDVNRVEE